MTRSPTVTIRRTGQAPTIDDARIRAESLLAGGQGRTAESIHRDSAGVVWALACFVLLVVLLVVGGGS